MERGEVYYLNPMGKNPFKDSRGNIKPINADFFCTHVDKKGILDFYNVEKKIRAVQNGIIEARKMSAQAVGEETILKEAQRTVDEFINMEISLQEKREELCYHFRTGIKEAEQELKNMRTNDMSAHIHGLRDAVKRAVEAPE